MFLMEGRIQNFQGLLHKRKAAELARSLTEI
jgi:hypothetical protein